MKGLREIDALLITHAHAVSIVQRASFIRSLKLTKLVTFGQDAILGLDDLRGDWDTGASFTPVLGAHPFCPSRLDVARSYTGFHSHLLYARDISRNRKGKRRKAVDPARTNYPHMQLPKSFPYLTDVKKATGGGDVPVSVPLSSRSQI